MEAPMTRRISSVAELIGRMRTGSSLLTKSYSRSGIFYECRGRPCDPRIAAEAIADGFLRPLDAGLFDDVASAQSFELIRSSK
jgi:hypothetical protein